MQYDLVRPLIDRIGDKPRVLLRPLLETFAWLRNGVIRDLFMQLNDSSLSKKGAVEIRLHKNGRKHQWLDGGYFGG